MCGLDKTYIVLTGPFLTPVQTKITSVQKYDLQCSYNEPDDKTYYSTMYVRPAKTQVSLCIDQLYKASFLDSPESEEGAYFTISEGSDQNLMLQSHCLSRFGQPGYRR